MSRVTPHNIHTRCPSLPEAHRLLNAVVRLAFVCGDGDPHLHESPTWPRQWPSHRRLQLIHHADVAQGLLSAPDVPGLDGRTYNLGDDSPVTAYELLGLAGQESKVDAVSRPLPDPWEGIVDTTRARREFGFRGDILREQLLYEDTVGSA